MLWVVSNLTCFIDTFSESRYLDQLFHKEYLTSLLECQHEEKVFILGCMIDRQSLIALQPSVQKLITSLAQDCVVHLNEEATHTDAYALDAPRVDQALFNLESEFSSSFIDQKFLEKATEKSNVRVARRDVVYDDTVITLPSLID